jgi:carboxypeptidase Taq
MKDLEERDLSFVERRSLEELKREQLKALRVPQRLVEELAETAAIAYESWVQARQASDFQIFAPSLKRLCSLKREEAECLKNTGSLYEGLLDEFEPGMAQSRLEAIFDRVRPPLTDLLQRITTSAGYSSVKRIDGEFAVAAQKKLGSDVLSTMGFDWKAGRLDESPHPFCTGFSPQDVRITTRYSVQDFTVALFGIIHEGGHALYEQGLDPSLYGLPICEAISLGIHESQSRLWENHVGRSRAFWRFWFSRLKRTFPGELDETSPEKLLRSVNLVESSPIRVTADEVTYGLHIILRFELEKALLNGDLEVDALPDEWNSRMETYLGIVPRNDAEGVLQDIHWSHGLLGYFPTYLLGNLYAAQIMGEAEKRIPDLESKLAAGDFLPLREWLRNELHRHGKAFNADELVLKLTGKPLNPDFFLHYLKIKFEDLYDL